MPSNGKHILAVVGMIREARLAADTSVRTIVGGGDSRKLALALEAALVEGAAGVVSFGIAGGVAPQLRPGAVIIATSVLLADGSRYDSDADWCERLGTRLPVALKLDLFGSDTPVVHATAKASLHKETHAAAVDMESHVAAAAAARFALAFAAIRVVAAPAVRTLPAAALRGMRPDGGIDVAAVLRALAAAPNQFPGLIRTAGDAAAAFASLSRVRTLLGPGFGLLDLG